MGWFPAEFAEEVRLARAEDLAERRRRRERGEVRGREARRGVDEWFTDTARTLDVGARVTRRGQLAGVAFVAGLGRAASGVALVVRAVIGVWLIEVEDPAVFALALGVVGVLMALRQVVVNCVRRRWRSGAASAAVASLVVVAAGSWWLVAVGGRPFMAVAFVLSEVMAWLALVLLVRARAQAPDDVVVA